jgi:hypothetical protein
MRSGHWHSDGNRGGCVGGLGSRSNIGDGLALILHISHITGGSIVNIVGDNLGTAIWEGNAVLTSSGVAITVFIVAITSTSMVIIYLNTVSKFIGWGSVFIDRCWPIRWSWNWGIGWCRNGNWGRSIGWSRDWNWGRSVGWCRDWNWGRGIGRGRSGGSISWRGWRWKVGSWSSPGNRNRSRHNHGDGSSGQGKGFRSRFWSGRFVYHVTVGKSHGNEASECNEGLQAMALLMHEDDTISIHKSIK